MLEAVDKELIHKGAKGKVRSSSSSSSSSSVGFYFVCCVSCCGQYICNPSSGNGSSQALRVME
jgi:hypothetical protein